MHGNGILLCDMMTMMIWDEQRKTGSPRFWHGSFIGNATTLLQIPGAAWARHLDLSRPHLKMGERGLNYSRGERMAHHYLHYSSLRRYRSLTSWVKSFRLEHFVLLRPFLSTSSARKLKWHVLCNCCWQKLHIGKNSSHFSVVHAFGTIAITLPWRQNDWNGWTGQKK